MKHILIFCLISFHHAFSQNSIVSNGGEASGLGGTASYTFGQVFDFTTLNSNFSIQEGVQQTYKVNTDGLLEMTAELFTIYPIPTTDVITIELKSNDSEFDYYIISTDGSLSEKGTIYTHLSTINLSELKIGEYQFVCKSDKSFFRTKIIKI